MPRLKQTSRWLLVCRFPFKVDITDKDSTVPDASHMVPIKVGDYLEFSGIKANGEILCYVIVVNVGVNTAGNQPGFVRVEDALIGIADNGADVEAARFRVGYRQP